MKEIALKESDISKLKEYPLDGIWSTESKIFYYKRDKDKDWSNSTLLKKLYITKEERVNRKIETINALQDSELATYKELVIPDEMVIIGGVKGGFTIREIMNSDNLSLILNNKKIPDTTKIELLKKIGELVRRVQSQAQEFYFGDLQDFNFLVDKEGNIYVIDLDSSAVNQELPLETKFIIIDKKTHNINKYRVDEEHRSYPSIDTDIYCYNTMVLNYLAGKKIHRLTYGEFYDYIEYLKKIGIPKPMIDIYINHYTDKENELVVDYLDEIPSIPKADYGVYTYLKRYKQNKKD